MFSFCYSHDKQAPRCEIQCYHSSRTGSEAILSNYSHPEYTCLALARHTAAHECQGDTKCREHSESMCCTNYRAEHNHLLHGYPSAIAFESLRTR